MLIVPFFSELKKKELNTPSGSSLGGTISNIKWSKAMFGHNIVKCVKITVGGLTGFTVSHAVDGLVRGVQAEALRAIRFSRSDRCWIKRSTRRWAKHRNYVIKFEGWSLVSYKSSYMLKLNAITSSVSRYLALSETQHQICFTNHYCWIADPIQEATPMLSIPLTRSWLNKVTRFMRYKFM